MSESTHTHETDVDLRESGHSPEADAALAAQGELTDQQLEALLAEVGHGEGDLATQRSAGPDRPDARGPQLARQVAGYVRRSLDGRTGETAAEVKAWTAVQDAHAEYVEAVESLEAIPREREAEESGFDAVIAGQLAKGEAPTVPAAATDWEQERRVRSAVVRVKAAAVGVARGEFDRVAARELPKRSEEAVKRFKAAEAKMTKLAPAALAAIEEWLDARDTAVEVVEAADPEVADHGLMDSEATRVLSAGRHALAPLQALVGSEHPVVTGQHVWLAEDDYGMSPPQHVREALAESDAGIGVLAAIEAQEAARDGEPQTTLSGPLRHRVHPDDLNSRLEWRPSRLKRG